MKRLRFIAICLFVVTALIIGWAKLPRRAPPQADPHWIRAVSYQSYQALSDKQYAAAELGFEMLARRNPDDDAFAVGLAFARAGQGKRGPALDALERAAVLGFNDPEELDDPELAPLHDDPRWAAIAERVRANDVGLGEIEQSPPMPGFRSIDGVPDGGLRFRVHVASTATARHPHRLVVWLHGSGGSGNWMAEELAPLLAEHRFALLVPTQKHWSGWRDREVRKLVDVTIPAAGKIPGVDAHRPVLLGLSAGGQIAINLWANEPRRWGGIIVDAAYPTDAEAEAYGQWKLRASPEGRAAPVYALVGDRDGLAFLWGVARHDWPASRVPLTVRIVKGFGHAWVVTEQERAPLGAWLENLP